MKQITCQETKTISERIVFAADLNDKQTLFGGKTLSLLDENAGLASFKVVHGKIATAGYDHVNFWHPITTEKHIKIESIVTGISGRQIEVFTKIISQDLKDDTSEIAFTSFCTLVALRSNKSLEMPKLVPETKEEQYLCAGFAKRLIERRENFQKKDDFLSHLSLD
ncbi:acyl-CoA thioesterase [Companilactobacillus halodurans]|uniref:Acyl-CoA thioesterase n=1 Tax=Companilactobacillus halodurans TaxID=2584183 RepID=A0A5P0ZL23_9LACO|nr:hotdog domain-containing protein [Companilactobacillus halodurans]MQS74892.1 acyl-CoA thioesterase [Companilactobacillus halodurans]MQS98278.1 acyl-CoA thioesterase [Companilactobacillus halodurans]